MSPDAGFARLAGRGLVAAGAIAAGAAIGALAERSLLRRAALVPGGDGEEFGMLRGTVHVVEASDGSLLHAEVDDPSQPDLSDLSVVFCHGYALNQDSWHFQRRAMRGQARLVFYDQRSHGRSDRAEFDSHHVDQLGSDLGSVIDALAPHGPLMLVGHSMGGMTVMALAQQRPELFAERVFGVALIATTATGLSLGVLGLPPALGRAVLRLAPSVAAVVARQKDLVERTRWADTDLGLLLTKVYSFGSNATDQAGRFVAGMVSSTAIDVLAEFLPALQDDDRRNALPALQSAEVLVIAGASDRLTPKEQSDEIVRYIPGAEYVVIPDSGHMLTIDRHEQVDALLLALLDRVRRDIEGMPTDGVA
ncbi:MAG: alpha/beta hydrolase [Actinomycetota bacterium]|nr:alpha/beta hydrolase [Actinomycetota bacterium]